MSSLQEQNIAYQPGDAFDILCPNRASEVEELLLRLDLQTQKNCAVQVNLLKNSSKKGIAAVVDIISDTRNVLLELYQKTDNIMHSAHKSENQIQIEQPEMLNKYIAIFFLFYSSKSSTSHPTEWLFAVYSHLVFGDKERFKKSNFVLLTLFSVIVAVLLKF